MTIVQREMPTVDLQPYRERVARLIDNWALLTTGAAASQVFQQLAADLVEGVPLESWRQHSGLCADGAPIELCETVAPVSVGPAYTCDLGPYDTDPATRLAVAIRAATRLYEHSYPVEHLITAVRDQLFPPHVPLEQHTLWLGAAHGRDHAARIKLYWNLCWKTTADAWKRTNAALAAVGCSLRPDAAQLCNPLAVWGFPRMLALSVQGGGHVSAKLYYRLNYVDLQRLAQLAAACDLPGARFEDYVQHMLRRDRTWSDDRAGVAVALDQDGAVDGLALYHYTWPYFADDAALRRRMLAAAPAFDWNVQGYRAASRLIDGPSRCRHLLGFGVLRAGATGLHVYASTGHLLP